MIRSSKNREAYMHKGKQCPLNAPPSKKLGKKRAPSKGYAKRGPL